MQDLLSKVTRYEALFELAGVINASADIEAVAEVLARRLKYVVDVFSWRYVCFDRDPEEEGDADPVAIVVDGFRGRADVQRTGPDALSSFEAGLWRDRRTLIVAGPPLSAALPELPPHLQRDDLEQISVNTLVEEGRTRALFLFSRRRQPFTDLDIKCLAMVCGFFHRKVHMLWEQQKMRDLEQAYLHQEVMLRQSEKLATLGRLSAGMAHELNNPTAVARQGTEQLGTAIARLGRAQYALGAAGLSAEQREIVARLEDDAETRAREPAALDPLARSDREQEVEDWLEGHGLPDPWEHASPLVSMGFGPSELDDLDRRLGDSVAPLVIDYVGSRFVANSLLVEIGHGAGRIAEIVKALKGYSYMDRAPIQAVDVREGLADTLVMLSSRLRDGVEVTLDFEDDLPSVQGYGSELNQVWTNLIDNAVHAMEGRGVLELRAHRKDDWVVVEVADTGPGIPPEHQDRIFDAFFTTKAPGDGTGLGLNISHGIIVEKHGGRISLESRPGATRFVVSLPINGPV